MYFHPVFSFDCALDESNANQSCNQSALPSGILQVFHGDGPPSGLQPAQNPSLAAVYYDDDPGGAMYPWNVATQSWPTIPEVP